MPATSISTSVPSIGTGLSTRSSSARTSSVPALVFAALTGSPRIEAVAANEKGAKTTEKTAIAQTKTYRRQDNQGIEAFLDKRVKFTNGSGCGRRPSLRSGRNRRGLRRPDRACGHSGALNPDILLRRAVFPACPKKPAARRDGHTGFARRSRPLKSASYRSPAVRSGPWRDACMKDRPLFLIAGKGLFFWRNLFSNPVKKK